MCLPLLPFVMCTWSLRGQILTLGVTSSFLFGVVKDSHWEKIQELVIQNKLFLYKSFQHIRPCSNVWLFEWRGIADVKFTNHSYVSVCTRAMKIQLFLMNYGLPIQECMVTECVLRLRTTPIPKFLAEIRCRFVPKLFWFSLKVNLCQKLFFLQNMGRTCCEQKLFSPGLSLEFSCIELAIQ